MKSCHIICTLPTKSLVNTLVVMSIDTVARATKHVQRLGKHQSYTNAKCGGEHECACTCMNVLLSDVCANSGCMCAS